MLVLALTLAVASESVHELQYVRAIMCELVHLVRYHRYPPRNMVVYLNVILQYKSTLPRRGTALCRYPRSLDWDRGYTRKETAIILWLINVF